MEEGKTYIIKKKNKEIWVTNINTSKDLLIDDLGITIKAGSSINLLNGRYTYITEDDINLSIASGALKKKGRILKVRVVAPVFFNPVIPKEFVKGNFGDLRNLRPIKPLEERSFEDLDFDDNEKSDEEFAMENADFEVQDRTPIMPVDPKLK